MIVIIATHSNVSGAMPNWYLIERCAQTMINWYLSSMKLMIFMFVQRSQGPQNNDLFIPMSRM